MSYCSFPLVRVIGLGLFPGDAVFDRIFCILLDLSNTVLNSMLGLLLKYRIFLLYLGIV